MLGGGGVIIGSPFVAAVGAVLLIGSILAFREPEF
jgi:hypothetical protein